MMIHDRKIFNCKVSLSIVKSLVIVAKEIWRCLDVFVVSEWYFRKNYHNSDGGRSHPVVLLPLVLNKK